LVGAGPGDPGLLTVRGRELLERADVVIHDRLGTAELLVLCAPGAELINAGKAPGDVAMTQDEINAALVRHGSQGKSVVRLKGGDPFVFGRGSEEALALTGAGIPFEVVPGITSAIGALAYAGVPVTHRGVSTSFTVVTGHEDPAKPETQTDWQSLARAGGTIVILMGMGRLGRIADELMAGGRPGAEPAAVVQWGTTDRQRVVLATLQTVAQRAEEEAVGSPSVVAVGPVAELGAQIAWRGGPLSGRSVVVTRARAQASELSARLRALGAEVIELPAIRIQAADGVDAEPFRNIARYSMIVLTSVNGVDRFFEELFSAGADVRAIPRETAAVAIGPATASRMGAYGLAADVVPDRYVAEGVLDALSARDVEKDRVLVARARGSRPDLVDGLRARGATVDEVHLYEAVAEPAQPEQVERALDADYLTFTSSSTVHRFMEQLPGQGVPDTPPRVISIGPITSETVRQFGLSVSSEADPHDIPGLIEALLADAGA